MGPFLPPIMRTVDLWQTLAYTYGLETVNKTLEMHPIKVRIRKDVWQGEPAERERERLIAETNVSHAVGYCQLWLQRYAPEVAIPSGTSRFLVLGTAALPAILLPRSLRQIGGDLDVALLPSQDPYDGHSGQERSSCSSASFGRDRTMPWHCSTAS